MHCLKHPLSPADGDQEPDPCLGGVTPHLSSATRRCPAPRSSISLTSGVCGCSAASSSRSTSASRCETVCTNVVLLPRPSLSSCCLNSAYATTLSTPGMCATLVQNSETKASWHLCQSETALEDVTEMYDGQLNGQQLQVIGAVGCLGSCHSLAEKGEGLLLPLDYLVDCTRDWPFAGICTQPQRCPLGRVDEQRGEGEPRLCFAKC